MSEKNKVFNEFVQKNQLIDHQADQFLSYSSLLREYNEHSNLTAISDADMIITRHFQDSLSLCAAVSFNQVELVVDVGSGGGFPGIPLKIAFPHLRVILIEVTRKKIVFLQHVIEQLGLKNIEVYPHDWRTFLRKTSFSVTYFLARASLEVTELLRIFKASSPYQSSTLVYWASRHWQPEKDQVPFIEREYTYQINSTQRSLIFFSNKKDGKSDE